MKFRHLPIRAIVVLLITAIVTSLLAGCSAIGKSSSSDYVAYIKDNELFISDMSEDGISQISSKLLKIDRDDYIDEHGEEYWAALPIRLAFMSTRITQDCKTIFYPDKQNDDNGTFSLYYRSIRKLDAEPVKIDSNVSTYLVNSDGTLVAYSKKNGNDYIIYQYDPDSEEKTKLGACNAALFALDGSTTYILDDGALYLKKPGKDAVKLDSNVDSIIDVAYLSGEYMTETFDTIYYMKNNAVYKASTGKDSEKLVSDVNDVICIYDSDKMYFSREQDDEKTLLDYVNDSYSEYDYSFTTLEKPEKPSRYDYDYYDEYEIAYEIYEEEYEEYRDSLRENADVESRNDLRYELSESTFSPTYSLYYFDGEKETLIADNYVCDEYWDSSIVSQNEPVILYSVYTPSSFEKPDIADVYDADSLRKAVNETLYNGVEYYIAADTNAVSLGEKASNAVISNDGSSAYYIAEDDLYSVSVKNGSPQKPVIYDSDVGSIWGLFTDDQVVYLKDISDFTGDLYINKERITSDTYDGMYYVYTEQDMLLFYSDFDDYDDCGTLNIYTKNKLSKIADDSYSPYIVNFSHTPYCVTPDGSVIYLSDYDNNNYIGQLSVYKNGKSTVIDNDVADFVHAYNRYYADSVL